MCDPIRSHPFPRASTVAVVAPRCCIHTSPYLRRLSDGGSTLQRRLPRPTMPQLPHLRRKTHTYTHRAPRPLRAFPKYRRAPRVTGLHFTPKTHDQNTFIFAGQQALRSLLKTSCCGTRSRSSRRVFVEALIARPLGRRGSPSHRSCVPTRDAAVEMACDHRTVLVVFGLVPRSPPWGLQRISPLDRERSSICVVFRHV